MQVFHGSNHIIQKPQLKLGKANNDYGRGFYCTPIEKMACEWATRWGTNGFVNEYTLDEYGLTVLDLQDDEYCVLHWLTILLENRDFAINTVLAQAAKEYLITGFRPDYESYDVIRGYRADDSYFSFAKAFLNGGISYQQLSAAMHLGDLGEQIVLKSEKAFSHLTFVRATPVQAAKWYPQSAERDRKAREDYRNMQLANFNVNDLYIAELMRLGLEANDERL